MDQTVLGIIILIVIWVLSSIANRKKKAAGKQPGQQTLDRKQQALQARFGAQTPKRIRFDTQTGQPIYETEPSVFADEEENKADPIDQYLATLNARREEEALQFEFSESDDDDDLEEEDDASTLETAREEREAVKRRIRELRARTDALQAESRAKGQAQSSGLPALGFHNRSDLVRGIIFSEIFQKPKSRRRGRRI